MARQTVAEQPSIHPLEEYEHIGAYLRDVRLHYRLSISEVAVRLHMRPKYVQALEEGRIAELPGGVYTRGYLHNYAEFLGLDGDDIVRRYHEIALLERQPRLFVPEPTRSEQRPSRKILAISAGLTLAVALLWALFGHPPLPERVAVEPLPEQQETAADSALVVTDTNRACLSATPVAAYPPCYKLEIAVQPLPFSVQPMRSVLELKH